MDAGTLYSVGFALIFIGTLIILAAIILLFFSSLKGKAKFRRGGAIIIGPFPIVFGTDKKSLRTVLLLSLALTILLIIVMVTFHFSLK